MKFLLFIFFTILIILGTSHHHHQVTASSSSSLPSCTFQDYTEEIQNTTCSAPTDQRKKIYRLVTDPNFCRGPSTLDLGETVSCVCTFQELEPIYTGNANQCSSSNNTNNEIEQINSVRTFDGFKKKDEWSTCILPQQQYMDALNSLLNSTTRCPCTANDISSFFSPCVDGAWKRLIHYFANDCDADHHESVSLPPYSYSPCALVCFDGEYSGGIVTTSSSSSSTSSTHQQQNLCQECPLGHFSFNGEQWISPYLEDDDDLNMKNIERECIGLDSSFGTSCPSTFGWRTSSDAQSFTSGDPAGVTDAQARMTIDAKIVRFPATLSFEFSVDSELDSDYFEVRIDDSVILRQSGRTYWQSFTTTIQSPDIFSDVNNHECQWTVAYDNPGILQKACVFPNQLFPSYDPALFWSVSPEQELEHQTTGKPVVIPVNLWSLVGVDVCNNESYFNRPNPVVPNEKTTLIVSLPSSSSSSPTCDAATISHWAAAANYSGILFVASSTNNNLVEEYLRYNRDSFPSSSSSSSSSTTKIKIAVLPASSTSSSLYNFAQTTSGRTLAASIHYTAVPGINRHIRFVYAKDNSGSSGTDRALVRNIVVTGTQLAPTMCQPCPAGATTPHVGSTTCTPCGMDTYAPTPASPQCSPCPANFVSGFGATQCVADRLCQAEDYEAFWSACQKAASGKYEKTRTFRLKVPGSCNESGTVSDAFIKSIYTATCNGNCSFGQFSPSGSTTCISCAANEIAIIDEMSATTSGCTKCLPGSTPIMQVNFDGFWQKLGTLHYTTSCTPTCTDGRGGWDFDVIDATRDPLVFLPDFLQGVQVVAVGSTVPSGSSAVLEIQYQQQIPGKISFNYFVLNKGPQALPGARTVVTFSILDATLSNRATIASNFRQQAPVAIFEITFSLGDDTSFRNPFTSDFVSPGEFILRWSYTNNQVNNEYIVFGIESILLGGAKNIASYAESCTPSPPGYSSPNGLALECAAGTFSASAGAQKCSRAPAGFVNPDRGTSFIRECPYGTAPDDAHIYCAFPSATGKYVTAGANLASTGSFKGRPMHTSISSFIGPNSAVSYEMDVTWLDGLQHRAEGLVLPANRYHDAIHFWGATPQGSATLNCTVEEWSSSAVSYGCVTSPVTGASRSIGSFRQISPRFSAQNTIEWEGVQLMFVGGTCLRYGQTQPNFTVIVNVDCDMEATELTLIDELYYSDPVVQDMAKVDPCLITVFAKYYKACPICTANNLAYFDEPQCSSEGKTIRRYAYVNANGDTPTDSYSGVCRSNVSGALQLPAKEQVDCSNNSGGITVTSSSAWFALFIVALIAIVVVAIIVHLKTKNQNLQNRFMKLQEEFNGGEMGVNGENDDDGSRSMRATENNNNDDDNTQLYSNNHTSTVMADDPYSENNAHR